MAIEVDSEGPVEHLAGVVLSVLVGLATEESLRVQDVMIACERDSSLPNDEREIRYALRELVEDGLLYEDKEEDRFGATRAAIRADRLTF
jgi:hypothetical protein